MKKLSFILFLCSFLASMNTNVCLGMSPLQTQPVLETKAITSEKESTTPVLGQPVLAQNAGQTSNVLSVVPPVQSVANGVANTVVLNNQTTNVPVAGANIPSVGTVDPADQVFELLKIMVCSIVVSGFLDNLLNLDPIKGCAVKAVLAWSMKSAFEKINQKSITRNDWLTFMKNVMDGVQTMSIFSAGIMAVGSFIPLSHDGMKGKILSAIAATLVGRCIDKIRREPAQSASFIASVLLSAGVSLGFNYGITSVSQGIGSGFSLLKSFCGYAQTV